MLITGRPDFFLYPHNRMVAVQSMNKWISIVLCTLSLVWVMRPVFPFVEYALNLDYIAEYLCIKRDKPESHCKGKCYLNKRLQEVNREEASSDEKSRPSVTLKEGSPVVIEKNNLHLPQRASNRTHFFNYSFVCKEFFSSLLTPPPKAFLC